MFDPDQMRHAVDIARLAFKCLKWTETQLDGTTLHLEAIQEYSSEAAITRDWMQQHWDQIPPDAKPAHEHLPAFANYFSTFLESSQRLVEEPAYIGDGTGWCCAFCSAVGRRPHIQRRKLTPADRSAANGLEVRALQQLAREVGVTERAVGPVMTDPSEREARALLAYGTQLLERLEARTEGPANLALWRRFAWLPAGSPIKGFALRSQSILDAEAHLAERLRRRAAPP